MKAMKIKFVIAAMTTMVAFSATACELKLSGDTKQIMEPATRQMRQSLMHPEIQLPKLQRART